MKKSELRKIIKEELSKSVLLKMNSGVQVMFSEPYEAIIC